MEKKLTVREFLRQFAKLKEKLRPGESVIVTRRGKPLGRFVMEQPQRKVELPDFEKDASRAGYSARVGDKLLARLLNDQELA